MNFHYAGEEVLCIEDTFGPGLVCPSTPLHIVDDGSIGIGSPRRTLLHVTDEIINVSSAASFGSGRCLEYADPMHIHPIRLIPEGGICTVETIRRRQRCVSCGSTSWTDETITCSGCQSQVFEGVW